MQKTTKLKVGGPVSLFFTPLQTNGQLPAVAVLGYFWAKLTRRCGVCRSHQVRVLLAAGAEKDQAWSST